MKTIVELKSLIRGAAAPIEVNGVCVKNGNNFTPITTLKVVDGTPCAITSDDEVYDVEDLSRYEQEMLLDYLYTAA